LDQFEIKNLAAGYGPDIIINNVNLNIESGKTVVIMGPSGGGKTTLLLSILGVITPSKGDIVLNGSSLINKKIEDRDIGFVPQDYGLFPHLNVLDNIAFGLKMRGVKKKQRYEEASLTLNLVDLANFSTRSIKELSGGQKQRVAIARALAIKPKMLLLDEPLTSIDSLTRHDVAKSLKELFSKLHIPIILVSHNPEDARFFSDSVAILLDGTIKQQGSLEEIKNNPRSDIIKRLVDSYL
jgi:ABC-type Fe3+/spermidine/putrescine transport system ATPase subunit